MLDLLGRYPEIEIPAGEMIFHIPPSGVEVDLWKLEETAFSHPEMWWGHDLKCDQCDREPVLSYREKYYCREHFKV